MSSPYFFAPIVTACIVVACFFGLAAVASVASAGKSVLKAGDGARTYALESKRRNRVVRSRGPRIPLPVGPAYVYNDYPYYYSRGYYPTHIGGYVYYSVYGRNRDPRSGIRCASWRRACYTKAGFHVGHASLRRQRGACKCR